MASDSIPHVVQDPDMSMWDDPSFTSLYDNFGASGESPFDNSRLFDMGGPMTADSPNYPVKGAFEEESARSSHPNRPLHSRSLVSSRSAESSSQDSASETSGRKRQNTSATSESPPEIHHVGVHVKREHETMRSINDYSNRLNNLDGLNTNDTTMDGASFQGTAIPSLQSFGRSMHALSLEPEFAKPNQTHHLNSAFDFESAASSPGAVVDMADAGYASQLQAQMKGPSTMAKHSNHDPLVSKPTTITRRIWLTSVADGYSGALQVLLWF